MPIIRLRADQACYFCGATTNRPHATLDDCAGAIGREMREAARRARASSRRYVEGSRPVSRARVRRRA